MIDSVAGEVVLVDGVIVHAILTHREIIHLVDETFKLRILLASQLLYLLPYLFALCVKFSFSRGTRNFKLDFGLHERRLQTLHASPI